MADSVPISGYCDQQFSAVEVAFRENFVNRGEIGAAVSVSLRGQVVVDLAGGWQDAAATKAWTADSLVNLFSVGKGFLATLAAMAVDRGLLDFQRKVIDYWPEYGQAGKEHTTVAHLLSHQAGLPALRQRLPMGAMLDWEFMLHSLEGASPWWKPGSAQGYHVNTFGFLVGELLARVTGLRPGELLQQWIAKPLGIDLFFGVPRDEQFRIAEFLWPYPPPGEGTPELAGLELMRHNAYWNPSGFSGAGVVNSEAWRSAEIPSTNGHGSARAVERLYAALAAGGRCDDIQIVNSGALRASCEEIIYGSDLILERDGRFAAGFQLTQLDRPLGPGASGFGHFGAGGSLGFCNPESGIAMGYVMNQLGPRWQNPRNRALIDATFSSLN
jgi:CubicO group peptidase (beta-lactamase class C family)